MLNLEFVEVTQKTKTGFYFTFILKKYPSASGFNSEILNDITVHSGFLHIFKELVSYLSSPTCSGSDDDMDDLINDFIKFIKEKKYEK